LLHTNNTSIIQKRTNKKIAITYLESKPQHQRVHHR
jgi:hypothetical protein